MKKILIIVGVIAAIIAVVLINRKGSNDGQAVTLEVMQNRNVSASILASGKLTHEDEVKLSPEVMGKVTALYAKEGDTVKKGQLVAQINDEAPRALVEQQRASAQMQDIAINSQKLKLSNMEVQWQRKKQLHDRKLIDDDSFGTATNDLDLARLDVKTREASLVQAKAVLEESEKNLAKTQVFSPLDGVVTSLDIKVGETAISSTTNVPGSSLMTIGDPGTIEAQVNVDEADIANIKVGEMANIVAIGYPDQPMKGLVKEIAITAKPPTSTSTLLVFLVKIQITDVNGVKLHPGMSARAEIFTSNSTNVLAVPIQAIVEEEDRSINSKKHIVYKYDNGIARKISIDTGIADDSYQQVKSGLAAGDRIVTGPNRILRNLQDGDKIKEKQPDNDKDAKADQK